MKKFIIAAAVALCAAFCVPCNTAAQKVYTQQGKTFVAQKPEAKSKSKSVSTGYKWRDTDGKEYDIMLSAKGKAYIVKTSKKSGKEYRKYLPDEIAQKLKPQKQN